MNIGTKIESLFKGFWDNTMAVSPVVASLVLVVVAITGAAGVGMIQGSLSSDVSDQAGTGDLSSASSTELLIAGSTTVQPVSELIAEAYMDDHQGVKVTVQGGGSGAGISSVGMGIVDIGAASKNVDPKDYLDKGYDLKVHKIGGSAVVVIGNIDLAFGDVSKAELKELYNATATKTGTNITDVLTVVQRSDASGTEETFAKYLFSTKDVDDAGADSTSITQATGVGNAGVLTKVESTSKSIGFVDFGFADSGDQTKMKIFGIYDPDEGKLYSNIEKSDIKDELKNEDGTNYITSLTRPLNYITNGEPTSMEQAFITFAQSPGASTYFEECGYFAITQFA